MLKDFLFELENDVVTKKNMKNGKLYIYVYKKGIESQCKLVGYENGFIFDAYAYKHQEFEIINKKTNEVIYQFTNSDNITKVNKDLSEIKLNINDIDNYTVKGINENHSLRKSSLGNIPIDYLEHFLCEQNKFYYRVVENSDFIMKRVDDEDVFFEFEHIKKAKILCDRIDTYYKEPIEEEIIKYAISTDDTDTILEIMNNKKLRERASDLHYSEINGLIYENGKLIIPFDEYKKLQKETLDLLVFQSPCCLGCKQCKMHAICEKKYMFSDIICPNFDYQGCHKFFARFWDNSSDEVKKEYCNLVKKYMKQSTFRMFTNNDEFCYEYKKDDVFAYKKGDIKQLHPYKTSVREINKGKIEWAEIN